MPPQMQHPQNNLLGKGSLAITNSEELFFQSKKTKSFQPLQIQSCVRHSRILSKCKFKTKTNQKNTYFINQFLQLREEKEKTTNPKPAHKLAFRLPSMYYSLGHGFIATVLFCFPSLFHRLEVEQRCDFSIAISSKCNCSCSILLIDFFNLSFVTPVKISWL